MKYKFNVSHWLIPVMVLAFFLRFSFATSSPPSINWDEASLGYNAYSIVKTSKDEWNRFLPLSFEAFGDFKLPGYIYTLVPFIALFGLEDWAVRLPSQIAGVFSVLLLYLLVVEINKDKKWALLSATLLAISPWHVFFSRVALEANLAFFYFLLGLLLFFKGLKKPNVYLLVSSALVWGIALFTYNSVRIFLPLFLVALFLLYRKEITGLKLKVLPAFLILLLFLGLAFGLAVFQDSSSRYYWVTILDQGAINYLNESRSTSQFPELITKLIYNRYVYFVVNFFTNYLSHFSLEFLFLKGGSNYQFSVPNRGLLYIIEIPFLLWGIFKLFTQKKIGFLILAWLFLAPIPSAITREAPHALRSIFMLGAIQMTIAFGLIAGITYFASLKHHLNKMSLGMLASIFTISAIIYFYNYFIVYPQKYSESWQYGMKEVVAVINQFSSQGKTVFVTKRYGEAHIFYLFYSKYPPSDYQNSRTLIRYPRTNWRWVDRLDTIYFVNDWEVKDKLLAKKGDILIASGGNYPENSKILKSILFLDGSTAFDVVEIQ